MKRIILLIAFCFGIFSISFAQEDVFTALNDILTEEEIALLDDAQKNLSKGDTYVSKAEKEEIDNAKLMNSSKAKKKKKAEKKLVDAKKYRIQAAEFYDKAYLAAYNVYMEIVIDAEWEFPEDGTLAQEYLDDANTQFADAQRTLAKYGEYSEDQLQKSVKYQTLKSDLGTIKSTEEEAVYKLIDAILLYEEQEVKAQERDAADNLAWKNAVSKNSIDSYKSYLTAYPTGIHAQEAASKIEALEEAFLAAQQSNSNVKYKVQICADKKKWTTANIKSKIYSGTESIDERYADGYYKYSIGEFSTYNEAKTFKNRIGVKGAFVVCFVDGEQVHVTKALEAEGVEP